MTLPTKLAAALAALSLATVAGAAQAATTVIDISSLNGDGTTAALAAGDYTIAFIGVAEGGAYEGYSPWGGFSGCDGAGMNCSTGYIANLAIDFGHGSGTFDRQDGYQHGMASIPGNNFIFATGAQARAAINAGPIIRAALPQYANPAAYSVTTNPISFTLAAAQSVNFFIIDYPYGDNSGGISIRLTRVEEPGPGGVPEPSTWALMILGFGAAGAGLRRRRAALA
ncbi:MAG: PEPxxWA-CTERM sorting domain-containing protein [Pseudomonadota bacterium]